MQVTIVPRNKLNLVITLRYTTWSHKHGNKYYYVELLLVFLQLTVRGIESPSIPFYEPAKIKKVAETPNSNNLFKTVM